LEALKRAVMLKIVYLKRGLLLFLQGVNERFYDLLKGRPPSPGMLFGLRSISLASLIIWSLHQDLDREDFIVLIGT
jgi:hypothetical protein